MKKIKTIEKAKAKKKPERVTKAKKSIAEIKKKLGKAATVHGWE